MTSFGQMLRKPYDYVSNLCFSQQTISTKTQQTISTPRGTSVFVAILSPFEAYVVSLQSLLIWEKPYLSAGAFITLNLLYWLIVSWNRRLFSILSIFALSIFLHRAWVHQIWPEIRVPPAEGEDTESWTTVNPDVLSVPELSRYLNDFLEKMIVLWKDVWKLRKSNHGLFCALMCGFFSFLAFIGNIIPGVIAVYIFVLIATLGPGVALHLIPTTLYEQMIGYFVETDSQGSNASKSSADSDLDEFVPEASPQLVRDLSLREEESPEISSPGRVLKESSTQENLPELTEETYINESDDFSLYQGLGSFPSVEEEEEDSDLDDISDHLEPPKPDTEKTELHFNLTHFKEDSSSSDSEAFTEGLSFNQGQGPSAARPQALRDEKVTKDGEPKNPEQKAAQSESEDEELFDFEVLEESDIPT